MYYIKLPCHYGEEWRETSTVDGVGSHVNEGGGADGFEHKYDPVPEGD